MLIQDDGHARLKGYLGKFHVSQLSMCFGLQQQAFTPAHVLHSSLARSGSPPINPAGRSAAEFISMPLIRPTLSLSSFVLSL